MLIAPRTPALSGGPGSPAVSSGAIALTALVAAGGAVLTGWLVRAARRGGATSRAAGLSATGRRVPAALRRPLATALDAAALDTTPEVAFDTWLMVALAALLLGLALGPPFAFLFPPAAAAAGPVVLRVAGSRGSRRLAAALPDLLERVASHLRGGASLRQALAACCDGPLRADLGRLDARLALGASFEDACRAWTAERDLPGVRAAAGALAVAATVGGPAADSLEGLAESLRDRLAVAAEARALAASARASAWVVGAAPAGYLCFAALVDRRSAALLVTHPLGRICLVAGLVLELLGALWMRRVLRGVG